MALVFLSSLGYAAETFGYASIMARSFWSSLEYSNLESCASLFNEVRLAGRKG